MEAIKAGDTYLYTATSRKYIIVGVGKMKVGDVWIESVTYYDEDNEELFTRDTEAFKQKFTKE